MTRNLLSLLMLAAVMGTMTAPAADLQTGTVEATDEMTTVSTDEPCADCWEKGSFTESYPVTSRIVTMPLRLTTAVIGAPLGMFAGMYKGTKQGASVMAESTFGQIDTDDSYAVGDATSEVIKTPILAPLGVAGTIVGGAVGGTVGIFEGAVRGTTSGFMVPDKF